MEVLVEALSLRWLSIMQRALLILGPLFLIFWIIKPRWTFRFRIPQLNETQPLYKQEVLGSLIGLSVYLIPIAILMILKQQYGYTKMYTDINEMGWPYFFFSIFFFIFFNDSAFYWTHRWMHTNPTLKKYHSYHHKMVNTTPFAAYSFHLGEALLNMLPYFFIALFIPWHPVAFLVYTIFGMTYNGYVHLGYDFAYKLRMSTPILKWFYTSTHHSIHHQTYQGNYAVYFTFWDRLMKTEISDTALSSRVIEGRTS